MEVERFDVWLHKGQIKYNSIANKETRQKKKKGGGGGREKGGRTDRHRSQSTWPPYGGVEGGVQS